MDYQEEVRKTFINSGIIFSEEELNAIEYADFGLGNLSEEGLNVIIYVNNQRYCGKEMVLLPGQTCPEHLHPDRDGDAGKQETFRCRQGLVYLYVEGEGELRDIQAKLPKQSKQTYTVFHEIKLLPGQQYTIEPNTLHWFQAGKEGAVITEFSSPSDDQSDVFTNPLIERVN